MKIKLKVDVKENLKQLHGFTGNRFIVTEGENKGVYDANSEGELGKFCKSMDDITYNAYIAGYEDGTTRGAKIGGAIVLGGIGAVGCTVACLYLLSKIGKKSKLKQPCLKKESE